MSRRVIPHGPRANYAGTALFMGEIAFDETRGEPCFGDGATLGGKRTADFSYNYALNNPYALGSMGHKLGEIVSLSDYGAKCDGATDDKLAIQAAFNDLSAGLIGGIFIPGIANTSDTITISASIMYGWKVHGKGRGLSAIQMTASNRPVFSWTNLSIMHSCSFRDFTVQYTTPQTGYTASAAFFWTGTVGTVQNNVFQCDWSEMNFNNCYYSHSTSNALVWGSEWANVWVQSAGGVTNLMGSAGQPHNTFHMYVKGVVAGEVAFKHTAMDAEYFVELNGCSGGVLAETGGGYHRFRHLAFEVATFTVNTVLFLFTNSIILADYIYMETLALAAGVTVTAFSGGDANGRSELDVRLVSWSFAGGIAAQGAGSAFFLCNYTSGTGRMATFGTLDGEFSAYNATPQAALTNFASAATSGFIQVTNWTTEARTLLVTTPSTTLAYNSPRRVVIGKAMTAAALLVLPPSAGNPGQNMFDARAFDFVKLPSAGTTYDITIQTSTGTTVATIPAATASGKKTVRFSRSPPDGISTGIGFYTPDPVSV